MFALIVWFWWCWHCFTRSLCHYLSLLLISIDFPWSSETKTGCRASVNKNQSDRVSKRERKRRSESERDRVRQQETEMMNWQIQNSMRLILYITVFIALAMFSIKLWYDLNFIKCEFLCVPNPCEYHGSRAATIFYTHCCFFFKAKIFNYLESVAFEPLER